MSTNIQIVFDNGGGVTLQTADGFTHHYGDMGRAAQDAVAYVDTGSSDGWEGNEPEHHLDVAVEQISNGQYCIYNQDDVRDYKHIKIGDSCSWQNVRDFFGNILIARN